MCWNTVLYTRNFQILKLKPFGVLAASNVVTSVKSLLILKWQCHCTRTPNGFDLIQFQLPNKVSQFFIKFLKSDKFCQVCNTNTVAFWCMKKNIKEGSYLCRRCLQQINQPAFISTKIPGSFIFPCLDRDTKVLNCLVKSFKSSGLSKISGLG